MNGRSFDVHALIGEEDKLFLAVVLELAGLFRAVGGGGHINGDFVACFEVVVEEAAFEKTLSDPAKVARDKESLRVNLQNLGKLYEAGVHIGFGTDSGANPLRIPGFEEHRELELMVQAGLTPLKALTVATGRAAALMGLSDRGEIVAGKRADFLIVEGDPTQDILASRRISSVWRGGKQVAGAVVVR